MSDPFVSAPPMTLRSVDRLVSDDITLDGGHLALVVGRHERCDVRFDIAAVSRHHAEIRSVGGRWHVVDLSSRHGTFINDARIGRRPVPLEHGDRVEFGPVAFRVAAASTAPETHRPSTLITTIERDERAERPRAGAVPVGSRLGVGPGELREIMSTLRDASDPDDLYTRAASVIVGHLRGGRCLFVRPSTGFEEIELLAGAPTAVAHRPLSRSLLRDSSEQGFVCLSTGSSAMDAQSIISAGITDAWCTPIIVDEHHAAYLYVDADTPVQVGEDEVVVVIETVCAVVEYRLDRFARHDIEERFDEMERELDAARTVQLRLMPKTSGAVGGRAYALRCEAGYYVAGDIFGLGTRPNGRTYAYLGDVTGHGVAPSLIMSAAKSHFDALLSTDLTLSEAVTRLNAYIAGVTSDMEFVTLAALEFDDDKDALTIVDAGHGYILMQSSNGEIRTADANGGIPVGIDKASGYESTTIPFDELARVVLMSDGIPEQINEDREQFGLTSSIESIRADGTFAALFTSLKDHAGEAGFNDDVTIASIEARPKG